MPHRDPASLERALLVAASVAAVGALSSAAAIGVAVYLLVSADTHLAQMVAELKTRNQQAAANALRLETAIHRLERNQDR